MQHQHNTSSSSKPRIGLIQSRGLGDIVIALPIAKWYHDRGHEVVWPIDEKFYPSFKNSADYVRFLPFKFQPSLEGFYTTPLKLLHENNCSTIYTLYSYLNGFPINRKDLYSALTFDQYKYRISKVPFEEKWNLHIKRDPKREDYLFDKLVKQGEYILIQDTGSNMKANLKIPNQYKDHQKIYIDDLSESIFDWLKIIENAKALFLIDSCFANLVEQLKIKTHKYFVFRSLCNFTPVMMSKWDTLKSN